MIRLNVILGNDLSRSNCASIPRITVPAPLSLLYLPSEGLYERERLALGLLGEEAGVDADDSSSSGSFLTLYCWQTWKQCGLSGSTAELPDPAATAINISGNNISRGLFFQNVSVSVTGLFWRWWLFTQTSGTAVTAPCLRSCWKTVCRQVALITYLCFLTLRTQTVTHDYYPCTWNNLC